MFVLGGAMFGGVLFARSAFGWVDVAVSSLMYFILVLPSDGDVAVFDVV